MSSQMTQTGGIYERERDVTKPCPQCGSKFVMVFVDEGRELSWPACNMCKFDGSPRFQGATEFEYKGMSDEEHFQVAYDNWDTLVDFITEEMEKTGLTAKKLCDKDKKETVESIPMGNKFAG